MTKAKAAIIFCAGLTGFMAQPASAACTTLFSSMLVVATPVLFASYNASASASAINGTITISCTVVLDPLPNFTIALSAGTAGGFAPRQMASGANSLNYNLYTTGSFGSVWGDGTGGSIAQDYTAGQNLTIYTVYGRIDPAQYVPSGIYTDNITVTITY